MDQVSEIVEFWNQLKQVSCFSYDCVCGEHSRTGWEGHATGEVVVSVDPHDSWIHFHEQCRFVLKEGGQVFELKNQYRWNLAPGARSIGLEHWRRGAPVHLVDLEPTGAGTFSEVSAHLCVLDHYRLQINLCVSGFEALWSIRGPKKQETLRYIYS